MIDVSVRLRRAIVLEDLMLVKRIITNNPKALQSPDFSDRSNTSLHLASKQGSLAIVEFLISAGHENDGISRNADYDTPLTLACAAGQVDVGKFLIERFPRCVPWYNKTGMDALMLASRNGVLPLLPLLLTIEPTPASTAAHDNDGNTALHHASAAGELKALRLLLQFGASPVAQNAYNWTPIAYSATVAAEVYFKNLVSEIEKRRVAGEREARERELERQRQRLGGVRLVTQDEAGGPLRPRTDGEGFQGMMPGQFDWSPVEKRRAMTPTAGRSEWIFTPASAAPTGPAGARARASSGD